MSEAFFQVSGIILEGGLKIISGDQNPSVVGYEAPKGSVYLCHSGKLYLKTGDSDTSWAEIDNGIP